MFLKPTCLKEKNNTKNKKKIKKPIVLSFSSIHHLWPVSTYFHCSIFLMCIQYVKSLFHLINIHTRSFIRKEFIRK